MELNTYVQGAIRTESRLEKIQTNKQDLLNILKAYIAVGNLLDDIKKNVFYKKPINIDKWNDNVNIAIDKLLDIAMDPSVESVDDIEVDTRLFHAIVGIATESTELVEAIVSAIECERDIDQVNVKEELGDLNWYQAIAVDATNADWNGILETNLNKLKKRYPERFTSEDAINRDLESERKILEGGTFVQTDLNTKNRPY